MKRPADSGERRVRVVVVVLLLAALGAAILLQLFRSDPVPTHTVTEFSYGWTIEVPEGWDVAPMTVERDTGLTFATYDLGSSAPTGWFVDRPAVPRGGAVLQIVGGRDSPAGWQPATGFPLSLTAIDDPSRTGGITDTYGAFIANGMNWEIIGWYGDATTPETHRMIEDMVASITFPSLPDPPQGEGVDHGVGFALGSIERFKVGSPTRIVIPGLFGTDTPIFVVRAPGGVYGIFGVGAWVGMSCAIVWDERSEVFRACDGSTFDIRADTTGGHPRPVVFPVSQDFDGDLLLDMSFTGAGNIDALWKEPVGG